MLFKQSTRKQMLVILQYADVAELADALDLGSSVYDVQVQLLSSAVFFCLTKKIKIKWKKFLTIITEHSKIYLVVSDKNT